MKGSIKEAAISLFKSGIVTHLLSGQYVTHAVILYEHFEKSHLRCSVSLGRVLPKQT